MYGSKLHYYDLLTSQDAIDFFVCFLKTSFILQHAVQQIHNKSKYKKKLIVNKDDHSLITFYTRDATIYGVMNDVQDEMKNPM